MLRGHDVRVLTLSQTLQSFESDGVTYIGSVGVGMIYPGARLKTAFFSSLVQKLVDWRPDIIHSQCEFSTFFIARQIAKSLNIPIIHTYHTVYEDYTHYFLLNQRWGHHMVASLSRWIIGRTSCVIAPTEKVRTLLHSYGIDQDVHVVPTGINLNRFTKAPATEKQVAIRKRIGIPLENNILLYVGRLAMEKNLEELLRYHAKCSNRNLTFLIVGDGPYRETLERIVSELEIRDSVRFTGMIPPEKIGDYYHLGTLFVSASVSETQGLTYIEALASGLPVLCRKDPCLDGVVLDGYNGWLYENEDDYFEKLNFFMNRTEIRKEMPEHAASLAQQMFSAAMFAEKVERVYLDVLYRSMTEDAVIYRREISCPKIL